MAFSIFSKQKQNESLALIVDIGSASVGAALVTIEKGKTPRVLATVREDISFQEALSSARFLFAMNQALDKVLKALQTKTPSVGNPKHVFCTLSSPWFILKTRTVRIARQKEFEVTDSALEEFIDEDIAHLKEELKETLPPQDVKIIEKKILHIKLNGYEVKNPYKQKTSQIEVLLTVGVSSGRVVQSIERKINNFFHFNSIHFGVFPVAAFSAIRDIFPIEKNFLFLDVTGEATDVSRIDDDLLVRTVSFSRGKNFFIREISAGLRTVHEEATSLFTMFLRGELNDAQDAQVSNIVRRAEDEWLTRFEKSLSVLGERGALPLKIFFTTDTDVMPIFSGLIARAKSKLLADTEFDVQYLDHFAVSKFVSFDTEVIRDPFIVLEVLLAQKLVEQHT